MQAIEAATRALAEDKDIELHDIDVLDLPEIILRGMADRQAFLRRYHDENLHYSLEPTDTEAKQAFYLLEQLRCELLGAKSMLGVASNISASIYNDISNKPNKAEKLYLSIWSMIMGFDKFPSYRVRKIAVKYIKELEEFLISQTDFAKIVFALLDELDFQIDIPNYQDKNKTDDDIQTDAGIEDVDNNKLPDGETLEKTIETAGVGQLEMSAGEIEHLRKHMLSMTDDMGDAVNSSVIEDSQNKENIPDYARQFTADIGDDSYYIYTTQFDKIEYARNLSTYDELQELRYSIDEAMALTQKMIGAFSAKLQRHILARQRYAFQHSYESGILDHKRLSRIVVNPDNPNCYQHRHESYFRDTVVTLLIDNSGSMRGRPIMTAAVSAEVLARSLERCGIRTEILGFTTQNWKGGESQKKWKLSGAGKNPGRVNDLLHIIYKSADMPWRKAKLSMGLMLRDGLLKENIDGEALLWAYDRLRTMPEERRILIVISDGAPIDDATISANGADFLESHLFKVIHWLERKKDIELLAIGIGHDVNRYYNRAVKITDINDLTKTLVDKMIELLI